MTQKERIQEQIKEVENCLKNLHPNNSTAIRILNQGLYDLHKELGSLPRLIDNKMEFEMTFKFKVTANVQSERRFKREDIHAFYNEYMEDSLADCLSDGLIDGLDQYDVDMKETEVLVRVIK